MNTLTPSRTLPHCFTTSALFLTACLLLPGCGGGGGGASPPPAVVTPTPEPATGLWVQGNDGMGLASYRARLEEPLTLSVAEAPVVGDAAMPEAQEAAGDFTTTYTLEADVDEHDIVKYDGRVLAVAPSRSGCCFAVEPLAEMTMPTGLPAPETGQVVLYQTEPASGTAQELATIALADDEAVEGLYLTDTTLQVLMSTAWWGTYGDALVVPEHFQSQTVRLQAWDLGDPSQPTLRSELAVDGALIASRRTGDTVHLIVRHAPAIDGLVPYPSSEADAAANAAVLADLDASDILPVITRNGAVETPLTLDDCYQADPEHPLATTLPADSALTVMLSVSATTGAIEASACTLEPVSGVYVSADQIALTFIDYSSSEQVTWVHVLSLGGFDYLGSERVDGHLYGGGNADFRISEYEGVLRLITTRFTDDPDDRFVHLLHTLAPESELPELELLATLGATAEDALGKPNEDLYGVRFLEDRAYLVTFERIDPLYVLDLGDPRNPAILGTLEVPGLSDLLHPVSADLLLGVGSTADGYSKVELFNIADPTQPRSAGVIILGAELDFSFSPAQYNRYAFTYRPGETGDRFTLPYTGGGSTGIGYVQQAYVGLFEVQGKADPESALISSVGTVVLDAAQSVSGDTRVVLDADAIYIANEGLLWGGLWQQPDGVRVQ